ncbi:MarR family transcriptional regulator [Chromohalobacter marismortui]|uniref:MarR family transcriptional regulator n=1 Tax=Chromohalobacter marismortui TaxID=42055 RepID=A0A4R7NSL3_9GAMM|nr:MULTISPECIES: MarR family transcriptional regulator [Chromohalobacter]MCI0509074.1 MarR family transcriptional regulator [Chromohalobacter sp.]MCI0592821.1 MarR family transcriptional regulator [Chromohalobacter sp.]TDU24035.1 MarR family transcriptional regulator [Chromohalobacter marismortui]
MDNVEKATRQWSEEMPELNLLVMAVIGRLKVVTRLVHRDYLDPFFKNHDLQAGEFDVLASLRRAGAPYALGPTKLYEALMITSGGMTNRLDRLEKAGLIARSPNPEDRRGTLVSLTDAGLEMINRIVPLHVENEAVALSGLTTDEQNTLNELLRKLIDGVEAGSRQPRQD